MFNNYTFYAERNNSPIIFRGVSSPLAVSGGGYRILIWTSAGDDLKWITGATLRDAEVAALKHVRSASQRIVKSIRSKFTVMLRIMKWTNFACLVGPGDIVFILGDTLLLEVCAKPENEAKAIIFAALKTSVRGAKLDILVELERTADWSKIWQDAHVLNTPTPDDEVLDLEIVDE